MLPRSPNRGPHAPGFGVGLRRVPDDGRLGVDDPGRQRWLDDRVTAADALRGIDAVVDGALHWLQDNVRRQSAAFPRPLRLTHDDVSPEHLLVDPDRGELVGILDWSDAALGNPARDFAPLACWHGWRFSTKHCAATHIRSIMGFGNGFGSWLARSRCCGWPRPASGRQMRWTTSPDMFGGCITCSLT